MTKLRKFGNGCLWLVGFLLSPLSPWNDWLINWPLAYGMTYLMLWPVAPVAMGKYIGTLAAMYCITNLAGMVLMHRSISRITNKQVLSMRANLLIAMAYTLFVAALLYATKDTVIGGVVIPDWVQP